MTFRLWSALAALVSLIIPTLVVAKGCLGRRPTCAAPTLTWVCAWFGQLTVAMALVSVWCVIIGVISGYLNIAFACFALGGASAFVGGLALRVGRMVRPLLRGDWSVLQARSQRLLRKSAWGGLFTLAAGAVLALNDSGWDATSLWVLAWLPTAVCAALAPLIGLLVQRRARSRLGGGPADWV